MTCETVNIVSEAAPGGYVVINKSDFDPGIHQLYEPPAPKLPKPKGDQKPPEGSKSKGDSEK
jgi:hypothetical protein